MGFKERWLERCRFIRSKDFIVEFIGNSKPIKPDDFQSKVENIFAEQLLEAFAKYDIEHQELRDRMNNRDIPITLKKHIGYAHTLYEKAFVMYQAIENERKQEAWADMKERIRYLVFRVLTAVGIAAVVLGTGYLAQCWGIPLPLLRVV